MNAFRIASTISILFLTGLSLHSQDTIVRTNGTIISANIVKAGTSQISYYRYADSTQTIYFLSTQYVKSILFKNGTIREHSVELEADDSVYKSPNNRIFNFSLFDLFFGNIYIRYEKLQGTGKLGLFVGGAINMSPKEIQYVVEEEYRTLNDQGYSLVRSYAHAEAGLNLYSQSLGPLKYGSGTSIILALYKTRTYDGWYDETPDLGSRFVLKWMWINQVRIDLGNSVQIYLEGDLSIAPRILSSSMVHLGFSVSF